MERYLLLRNNREAGPFTKEELMKHGLLSSDLVWVEGRSRSWSYPAEVEGLETFAARETPRSPANVNTISAPAPPSLQEYHRAIERENWFRNEEVEKPLPLFGERLLQFETAKKAPRQFIRPNPALLGLAVLFVGVVAGAFILKKMVDTFSEEPAPSAQAIELKEESLPTSTSVHTAHVHPAAMQTLVAAARVDSLQQKALPLKKADTSPAKETKLRTAATKTEAPSEAVKMEASPEDTTIDTPDEKPEPAVAPSRVSSLQLSANDFKVGLFGGISDLEITVTNSSSQTVNTATIEIEFLKPNGNVVKTQTLAVEQIPAGSTKKILVPPSGRGVKVRYRVINAE